MFAGMLCLLALADERYMGLHIIFFSSALMFIFYNWVLVSNLQPVEKKAPTPEEKAEDDGFEHL